MAKAAGKAQKLKVFRTPIGFHDAYVAAPSQKAALEAWGSDTNLFARGTAEQVTDPELTKEPLERPGEVIRKLRGTEEEQIATLGEQAANKERRKSAARNSSGKKQKPKPSRAPVEKAEKALEQAEQRQREALAKIEAEEQALERRRRELQRKHERESDRLREALDEARERHRAAMDKWASD